MKNLAYFSLGVLCALLSACCSLFTPCSCYPDENLLRETWIYNINLDTQRWVRDMRYWPQNSVSNNRKNVKICQDFSTIRIQGNFEVQVTEGQDKPSLSFSGPAAEIQQIQTAVRGNTLFLYLAPNLSASHVVAKVGLFQLHHLALFGNGTIYARGIYNDVDIFSAGNGNIFMSGRMNLSRVEQRGSGNITVMGAYTPELDVLSIGDGNVNINGRVGVRSLYHVGSGEVNIMCADTTCLTLITGGSGLTTVLGCVAVKQIIAMQNSRVYLFWVDSQNIEVYGSENAVIGLAGSAAHLHVDLHGNALFLGSYLLANNNFVRTDNCSHAVVTFLKKMFVRACGSSNVYYYGPISAVSQYMTDTAAIIPVGTECVPRKKVFIDIRLPCGKVPVKEIYP